jgi:hypothetical protein
MIDADYYHAVLWNQSARNLATKGDDHLPDCETAYSLSYLAAGFEDSCDESQFARMAFARNLDALTTELNK